MAPLAPRSASLTFSFASAFVLPVVLATPADGQGSVDPGRSVRAEGDPEGSPDHGPASRAPLWWSDVDGDGDRDVLALVGTGRPVLLVQESAGVFTDATAARGLEGLDGVTLVGWRDLDGDGRADLYLGGAGQSPRLWRNVGALFEPLEGTGLEHGEADRRIAFGDLDGNALEDLLVESDAGTLVYRNLGDWRFERVELPLDEARLVWTIGAAGAVPTLAPEALDDTGAVLPRVAATPDAGPSVKARDPHVVLPSGEVTAASVGATSPEPILITCLPSMQDQASSGCVMASSLPTLGMLYPLGPELNVDAATGYVGVNTTTPLYRVHVVEPTDTAIFGQGALTGVRGDANLGGGSGGRYGGYFTATGGSNNVGVFGQSSIGAFGTGSAIGTLGTSGSSVGVGVKGQVSSASGSTIGVLGEAASPSGTGIKGEATAGSGATTGVHARALSSGGTALLAEAPSSSGTTTGMRASVASSSGIAVRAEAGATSGTPIAVYGTTSSPNGYACYFDGLGHFTGNVLVAGQVAANALRLPAGAQPGHVLTSDASGNASWSAPTGGLGGSGTSGYLARFTGGTAVGNSAFYESSGLVGLGTTSPFAGLHVAGGVAIFDDSLQIQGTAALRLVGTHLGGGTGGMLLLGAPGNPEVWLRDDAASRLVAHAEVGTVLGPGNVGIRTVPSQMTHALTVVSASDQKALRLIGGIGGAGSGARLNFGDGDLVYLEEDVNDRLHLSTSLGVLIDRNSAADGRPLTVLSNGGNGSANAAVFARNASTANSVALAAEAWGTGTAAQINNRGTGPHLACSSGSGIDVFRVEHNGRVITTEVQITGGADIVEGFVSREEDLAPGTVVVISAARPGELETSERPYDRRVAGVVSGAGGVRPGLRLGQVELADGDLPVALTGRVYVRCSAENGPIEPGDRLTTAALRGHAMRVTDEALAPGAVIGKAMSRLEEGTGLVLVLVNLQ